MSKHCTEHRPLEGVHPGLSRRAWRGEEAFIPETIEQAIELATRLMEEAGAGRAQADALVLWLARRAYAGEDTAASEMRSRYRKLLGRLDPPALTPPPKGRRPLSAAALAGVTPDEWIRSAWDDHATWVVTDDAHNLRAADYVKHLLELGVAA